MAEAPIIKTFRSGATGLIRSLCNEIKLVEHINHVVTWDEKQWKVSPGQHILALIINTLCGRVPLYPAFPRLCNEETLMNPANIRV